MRHDCIAPGKAFRSPGFTLVEILVALVGAGLLIAMIAAVLGRGVVASSALEDISRQQRFRVVLYNALSMDLRNMLPDSTLTATDHGFTLDTSHNHLVPGSLPVTVEWIFSNEGVVRAEEQIELDYNHSLELVSGLEDWNLAFFDLSENRWLELRSWLQSGERPAPAGLRLELRLKSIGSLEFLHRLPVQREAAP